MERKIMNQLVAWKLNKKRKPLILQGVRQVGKTYSILMFGKQEYTNTVYFNFDNNEELQKVFERNYDTCRIVKELEILAGDKILKHNTLLFFDEIQASEMALSSLKYFNEENNDYHIIAAGSLLGVAMNREKYSFPVGKVDSMTLYPMDFEEFLIALNKGEMVEMIRKCYENNMEFSLHEMAMDLYRKYLVVGGMPAVVMDYVEKEDFNFVTAIQKNIYDNYIADMAKYATPVETIKIMATFRSLPSALAKENKKFQYKNIKTGARAYDYELPIAWLESSGIINKVCKVTQGTLPLVAFAEYNTFKLYMADTGLLCCSFGLPANKVIVQSQELNGFKGALTENYVAAVLKRNGYVPFYWESNGQAEVDFVIQNKEGDIIPIEVKAAENVRSKSLSVFVGRYQPPYAIRISGRNFGFENQIKSIPLYAAFCL